MESSISSFSVPQKTVYENYTSNCPCNNGDWCYKIDQSGEDTVYYCSKLDSSNCPNFRNQGKVLITSQWASYPSNGSTPLTPNPNILCYYQSAVPPTPVTNEIVNAVNEENDKKTHSTLHKVLFWIFIILIIAGIIEISYHLYKKHKNNKTKVK